MASRRIAINCGGGYAPGLNCVVAGAALAAQALGWEIVGIHDGYEGLLAPEAYPGGGLVRFDPRAVDALSDSAGALGTAARIDPFRARRINQGLVEEIDRSDELLAALGSAGIDAVISVVGGSALSGSHALSVAYKLSRKGLPTVCIPKSPENDIAATTLSFGFNTALTTLVEMLDRIRTAARDVRRVAVVETPGAEAGWLALQAALAVRAEVVLIPEIRYNLEAVAATLNARAAAGLRPSLVIVAEGAKSSAAPISATETATLRRSLAPHADSAFGEGAHVIDPSGVISQRLAAELRRLTGLETMALPLGLLTRGGAPSAVDRQLGHGYGAAAVRALAQGRAGVMTALDPPRLAFVPLADALNRVRTVPADSEFISLARSLGLCLGDEPA